MVWRLDHDSGVLEVFEFRYYMYPNHILLLQNGSGVGPWFGGLLQSWDFFILSLKI